VGTPQLRAKISLMEERQVSKKKVKTSAYFLKDAESSPIIFAGTCCREGINPLLIRFLLCVAGLTYDLGKRILVVGYEVEYSYLDGSTSIKEGIKKYDFFMESCEIMRLTISHVFKLDSH